MKKKVGIITSAVATIAVCSSMIVGSTFALFTSEDTVNIAVTAGNVSLVATPEIGNVSSSLESGNPMVNADIDENSGVVSLEHMVPGDKVDVNIGVVNYSTVSVKYALSMNVVDDGLFSGLHISVTDEIVANSGVIAPADSTDGADVGKVVISIELPDSGNNALDNVYQGKACSIDLDLTAVQGNADSVATVGNVTLIDNAEALKAFGESVNAGKNYEGEYVVLTSDIDLNNVAWTPIGSKTNPFCGTFNGNGKTISNLTIGNAGTAIQERTEHAGLFGYIGYTENVNKHDYEGTGRNLIDSTLSKHAAVTNLNLESVNSYGIIAGSAVGYCNTSVIRNVTATNVTVDGGHYVGGIVGYVTCEAVVDCCSVETADLKATVYALTAPDKDDTDELDKGDKVGGIVGLLQGSAITNCSVNGATVSGFRDIGGLAGISNNGDRWKLGGDLAYDVTNVQKTEDSYYGLGCTISGNVVNNVTLIYNNEVTDADNWNQNANPVLGRNNSTLNGKAKDASYLAEDVNKYDKVTLPLGIVYVHNDTELLAALNGAKDGDVIFLMPGDYVMPEYDYTADITLRGTQDAKLTFNSTIYLEADLTIEGLSLIGGEAVAANGEKYNNVIFFGFGAGEGCSATLNGCAVKGTIMDGSLMDTLTIKHCTLTSLYNSYAFREIYGEYANYNLKRTVNFLNNTVKGEAGKEETRGIEFFNATVTANIKGNTFDGLKKTMLQVTAGIANIEGNTFKTTSENSTILKIWGDQYKEINFNNNIVKEAKGSKLKEEGGENYHYTYKGSGNNDEAFDTEITK